MTSAGPEERAFVETEAAFRAFLTKHNRLLQRIPLANGARDTPPCQIW